MQAQSWRSDPDTQLVYVLSENAFYNADLPTHPHFAGVTQIL